MSSENTFTKIAEFPYSAEAQIIRGKLESAGIGTYMRDGVTIDADPLLSQAIGGVKLFVRTEDFERAKALLTDVTLFPVEDAGEIKCPNCDGAQAAQRMTLTALFRRLFSSKTPHRCHDCGTEFNA